MIDLNVQGVGYSETVTKNFISDSENNFAGTIRGEPDRWLAWAQLYWNYPLVDVESSQACASLRLLPFFRSFQWPAGSSNRV